MDFIQNIVDGNNFPVFTAFMLGLIVALHPCPLAANIAAMGYIAKDVTDRHKVFIKGLIYTAGRMLAYSLLGAVLLTVLRKSIDIESAGRWFAAWGETLLGPVLIAVGLYFILDRFIHRHEHCPDVKSHAHRFHGTWGCFMLGVLLAMSFCPESAIVYFGMLMPLSARSQGGWLLPVVFSLATSVPTLFLAWGVAYGVSGTSALRKRMDKAQRWINVIVGTLFIGAGVFCLLF